MRRLSRWTPPFFPKKNSLEQTSLQIATGLVFIHISGNKFQNYMDFRGGKRKRHATFLAAQIESDLLDPHEPACGLTLGSFVNKFNVSFQFSDFDCFQKCYLHLLTRMFLRIEMPVHGYIASKIWERPLVSLLWVKRRF